MDELKEIRTLLPEPAPPSPAVVARARAGLTGNAAAVPMSRRRRVVLPVAIGAVAAAAVVAAVVVAVTPGDQPADPEATVAPVAPRSGRDVLLMAATKAMTAPGDTGRYWRLRTLISWTGQAVGTAPDTYTLEQRVVFEYWLGSGWEGDWSGRRDLGARPATPADVEAWRRAGSPASWDLGADPELQGRHHVLSSTPDAGIVGKLDPTVPSFAGGLTASELRDLPADAAALKTLLLNRIPTRRGARWDTDAWLRTSASGLLVAPVPGGVRSAAFQLLAELGGVESRGAMTDPLGRKGTGITLALGDAAKTVLELIIDPDSGQLLSQSSKAGEGDGKVLKESYTATLSAGWTDDEPGVPGTQVP